MTATGPPGLLLSATAADRYEAGYTGSFPSFPAFPRGEFSPLLVALVDPSLPLTHVESAQERMRSPGQPQQCSGVRVVLAPSFSNPPVSCSGAGYPGQCRRLRPDGLTSPPDALGWDVLISQLTLNVRVWEDHCREEGKKGRGGRHSPLPATPQKRFLLLRRPIPSTPQGGKVFGEHPAFIEN